MTNLTRTADHLAECLKATGRFEILSEGNGKGLPLVAFCIKGDQHYDEVIIKEEEKRKRKKIIHLYIYNLIASYFLKKIRFQFDFAAKLRERGWIVPAYYLPKKVNHRKLCRVVVREDFSRSRCELLLRDMIAALKVLDLADKKTIEAHR